MSSFVTSFSKIKPQQSGDFGKSLIRIPRNLIDASKQKKEQAFFRRELVVVRNRDNGNKIVRYVVGDNNEYNLTQESIALDYDARDALGIRRTDGAVSVEVRRASLLDMAWYYWNSDDRAMRIANRLGAISLAVSAKEFVDLISWLVALVQ